MKRIRIQRIASRPDVSTEVVWRGWGSLGRREAGGGEMNVTKEFI